MPEPTHVAPTASLQLDPGTTLGNWELVEVLGKGAMGCVYRARHVRLGREAAIKVLNPEYVARPDVVQRFFREARVVNEIDHAHIVEVTDFVETPGLAYLVMELLEGESLRDLLQHRGRRYPKIERILDIMRQVCGALDAAHAKGVVHRDLKPDNVFVTQRDGADFVKVLDFGVARLLDHADQASTVTGMILGTPHYMSPEQALGKPVARDADLWAAGVVLFELLAGNVPFTAPSFVELAVALREKPPKELPAKTRRGERIPAWLAQVVLKCLEKRPEDRYRTMAQLAEALAGPGPAPRGRRALAWAVAGVAAVAVAAGAAKLDVPRRARELAGDAATAARAALARATPAPLPPRQRGEAGKTSPAPAAAPPVGPLPRGAGEREASKTSSATPTSSATSTAAARPSTATPTSTSTSTSTPSGKASKPAVRTVELHVRSTPPGATVVRLDTGKRLGKTPLRVAVPRKAATVWLQLRLDGHVPVKFSADLREDVVANVTLKHARRSKTARH